jgi:hypothetical protein
MAVGITFNMGTIDELFYKALNDHIDRLKLDETELNRFIKRLPEIIPGIISDSADSILATLKDDAPVMLKERRSEISKFEERNQERWKPALDLFEMFLVIAYEAGAEFNETFRDEASRKPDYVFDVLVRLHARGCQIGFEILSLIKSGFADAAHARWRTLHENAVVAFIVDKYGQDIAERYRLHEVIESYKAMLKYQVHCSALNDEPFSEQEIEHAKEAYDSLLRRFGNSFKGQYGWAAEALHQTEVHFNDLEKQAGLAHLSPYYKMASHNVHANVKGILFKLGLAPQAEPVLLAGPSNYGFADPADGTAISLTQITVALLNTRPSMDRLVILTIMLKLEKEIGNEFLRIQRELENEMGNLS